MTNKKIYVIINLTKEKERVKAMSDLIMLYLYYVEMRDTTDLDEEYKMFDQLAHNLRAILRGLAE